ncbi:MAG: hypothetical protein ACI4EL_09610 [Candidatus Fimimorpha sp.]
MMKKGVSRGDFLFVCTKIRIMIQLNHVIGYKNGKATVVKKA